VTANNRREGIAMPSHSPARLDYEDYAAIPADGKRYELLAGELHVSPAPSPHHQRLSCDSRHICGDGSARGSRSSSRPWT
jgi:hypothetical protein